MWYSCFLFASFCWFDCDLTCVFFFFFSSRRRHTRCLSDWSSDVCSSDLRRRADDAAVRPDEQAVCRRAAVRAVREAMEDLEVAGEAHAEEAAAAGAVARPIASEGSGAVQVPIAALRESTGPGAFVERAELVKRRELPVEADPQDRRDRAADPGARRAVEIAVVRLHQRRRREALVEAVLRVEVMHDREGAV